MNAYTNLVLKYERKKLLGRPRCRWSNNIEIDLKNSVKGVWTGFIWF
jgi:hypothetical protein